MFLFSIPFVATCFEYSFATVHREFQKSNYCFYKKLICFWYVLFLEMNMLIFMFHLFWTNNTKLTYLLHRFVLCEAFVCVVFHVNSCFHNISMLGMCGELVHDYFTMNYCFSFCVSHILTRQIFWRLYAGFVNLKNIDISFEFVFFNVFLLRSS